MSNPTLREEVFTKDLGTGGMGLEKSMTTSGTLGKTCILALLMALTFGYTWSLQGAGFVDKASMLMTVGAICGFIMAMIICFAPKNKYLAVTTSIYALFEGLFLGGISAVVNTSFPGIVPQAMLATILTIGGMYFLYTTKIIKCTDKFRKVIFISTFAIAGVYILQFILGFFGMVIPGLFSNTPFGIGISVIIVAIAAFNLIVDFDFIENFSGQVPDYFEWYGGFSLMVTIVWLYIEILKLLAKMQSRR
ncbi:Bax inhibitor-1/YccA family protein [bacterium]|nr:Bax inhibitor-1/YccA family protein [bacterium]